MEGTHKRFQLEAALSVMVLVLSIIMPINGQITTPCTASMISSFSPCMGFITGSSPNGSSPTSQCCGTLRQLVSGSMDCACLLITASVPIQLPNVINRTLAISLPRACNMGGVPLGCKASAAPLPSPGTVSSGPAPSPSASGASVPTTSTIPDATSSPALAPEVDTTILAPASVPVDSDTPIASNPGRRPVVTPNGAAKLSHISSPFLLFVVGILVLKNDILNKSVALAEWLRRVPAKYMGFPRESSNLSGDDAFYGPF
ncbi:Bifunctional inhibitor/lipid-transfer protein/seed storage 2S albumin superfamily protein [Thalictrum thalictroides]|uniref:Bifunctional inhibitor/lipid-transfer protein/seed storage 2S albumin superfamily protein n=1 Tax=Thalictrum thalictroides TaxID=46969 RepID=A0A7J6W9I5_THATH|nr:Bifunctional inhibitor/lipid-transfer protein/seed storage 2S albumin superfamily protein [Thalictrum thalictroides]